MTRSGGEKLPANGKDAFRLRSCLKIPENRSVDHIGIWQFSSSKFLPNFAISRRFPPLGLDQQWTFGFTSCSIQGADQ